MTTLARILEFFLGVTIVFIVLDSALRTFVLPRGSNPLLSRAIYIVLRVPFRFTATHLHSERRRDALMALYAPAATFILPLVWLILIIAAFTLMFHAVDPRGIKTAFVISGSSVFTLGFVGPNRLREAVLAFSEAGLGLILLSLVIAYVPTIYGAFSRREVLVAQLGSLAGTPPTAEMFLARMWDIDRLTSPDMGVMWEAWQYWFAEIEETHTSLGIVAFFRSPDPGRSWVTAAGTVLDSAALLLSSVDIEWQPKAGLTLLTGRNSLRKIAANFKVPFDPEPTPTSPISVTRGEYDAECARLELANLPLKADRNQAWRDYAGWRVNYDDTLLGLAALTLAPPAPWTSDRTRTEVSSAAAG